ncbi:MAG: DMT family transporter [Sphingomonadaceae bacterium]
MRGASHPGPILVYCVGIAFFCAMDAIMKALVAAYPAVSATFWRYVAAILFILPFWLREGAPPIRRDMWPPHLLRGAFIAAAAFLFFWSLTILPLAEAVTFAFIAPLLIPPMAALFLKERMEARSLVAALLGFLGVLVAVGADPATIGRTRLLGVGAVLLSAFSYAVSIILLRARAEADGPSLVSLMGAMIPAAILLPFVLMLPAGRVPVLADWPLVLAAGLAGAIALQFIARAYARAQAQLLAPFEYTALFWAALFGWAFFGEGLSWRTLAGAAIIVAACIWQARPRSPAPSSPPA